MYHAMMYPVLS